MAEGVEGRWMRELKPGITADVNLLTNVVPPNSQEPTPRAHSQTQPHPMTFSFPRW